MLYLRYSSNNQTEQSIEGQDRVCRSYARQNGIDVVGSYVDRAKSAAHDVEKRTEFLRMVRDARKGGFNYVLVYKLDRFARDRYDSAIYKAKLKQCGVQVISATEALSGGPESVIMESLLEGMAEYYSLELSQKVRRGINESAAKRRYLGGLPPLGLKSENNRLVPDPDTANIVQEIFCMADEGFSIVQIINTLNSKGYRSGRGTPFKRSSLNTILHNKRYIGYYIHNDMEVPGVIEPILDEDVFWRVQERLKVDHRRKKHKNQKDNYLLSGKLFCGCCGEPMLGESGKGKGGTVYRYYKCFGAKQGTGCRKKAIRKDLIESFVIDKAKDLLTEERIERIADAVMGEVKAGQSESKIPALERNLADLTKQIGNALDAILGGVSSPALTARLQDLEEQKAALELTIAEAKASEIPITRDMVVFYLHGILERTAEVYDSDRVLVDALVQKIVLYDDEDGGKNRKVKIIFNLTENGQFFEDCFDCSAI